jgi:hypothetical protein
MADIRVLMVTDGNFFNYGPQTTSHYDANCFSLVTLVDALNDPGNIPSIQVDTAHRRGEMFAGQGPDTSQNLTYPGDFVFTDVPDLSVYDVIWLIGDEGYNGTQLAAWNSDITADEQIAIADFMQGGGGVFAVGDHDGLGACMCGGLPRIRVMRKWFEWDHAFTDPTTGEVFMPNWSVGGDGTSPGYPGGMTDRFDTLQSDATLFGGQQVYFFWDQSDPKPQTLMDAAGNPLTTSPNPIHAVLRGTGGVPIADFPDHMHEGEATDFSTILASGASFDPNGAGGTPNMLTFIDKNNNKHQYQEFQNPGGYQPTPEIIAYGQDVGHATYYGSQPPGHMPDYPATNEKVHGTVCVYDGYGANVGRVVTGSTFHHYLDKNLIGDPLSNTMVGPPTNTTLGLPPATLDPIKEYYVNVVTWLARANPTFHFWTLKNTFGADEVQSAATSGTNFPDAFYLALEGFAPSVVGNPTIALSGAFAAAGAKFQQGATPIYSGNPNTPQRILFPFTVLSIPGGAFPSHGSVPTIYPLEANIAFGAHAFSAETLFELAAGADPYFTNVDANTNPPNAFYLSQDLRVFQVVPDLNEVPFIGFPGGADAPFGYVGNLLNYLNDPSNGYTQQGGTDPFQTLSEQNDLTEDSSVSNKVLGPDNKTHTAYNFAIARVRMRGAGSMATNTKVFFRMFATQSNDTDYDPQTTYLSTYDALNLPDKPLNGVDATTNPPDNLTFAFFATSGGTDDYDLSGGNPGANEATISSSSNNETYHYFGCYLNVGDLPPNSLPGTHHCLVAQIAYDGAPLLNSNGITLSPENTNKLAQRNLQVTWSGNPGGPATHRIPQTFDNKPSLRTANPLTTMPGYPDELMIDWGNTPKGSVASIYWPQASSLDVVRLSMLMYADVPWTATDGHTVQCTVEHPVTYLPIPFGTGASFAGLFTIDLPIGVKAGQQFNVVVRRVRSRQAPALTNNTGIAAQARVDAERKPPVTDWRYIVGTFQVTIPVSTEAPLLWPEENTLAIMKWRFLNTAPASRWYPVLQRYLSYLVGRVNGFGGKAGAIPASPNGAPEPGPGKGTGTGTGTGLGECGGALVEYRGKVCEVLFDCFGDFEGFVLESCCGTRRFTACESGIADVVLRACRERLVLSVFVEQGLKDKIRQLMVTCC